MDGSGRVALLNRKFLRKFIPVILPRQPLQIDNDMVYRKKKISNMQLHNDEQCKEIQASDREETYPSQIMPADIQEPHEASNKNLSHQKVRKDEAETTQRKMKNKTEQELAPSPTSQQTTTSTGSKPSNDVPPDNTQQTVNHVRLARNGTDGADVPATRLRRNMQRRHQEPRRITGKHEQLEPRRSKWDHKPPASFTHYMNVSKW